jgi:ribosomal protein S27AE
MTTQPAIPQTYNCAAALAQQCPRCTAPGPHQVGPEAGPHHQRLVCGQCGAFLRWLPKPHTTAEEAV